MNIILLLVSILIYASYGLKNFIFILFSIFTTFFAAKNFKSKHKKKFLIGAIVVNALILILVKFLPYGASIIEQIKSLNILVPLGISYYTLQVISYIVDVYKGKTEAETSLFKYMLSIMYIPQLFIGPISRYADMKKELFSKRKLTWENLYSGLLRISWGLLKKLVIAGRVSLIIATITKDVNTYNGLYALLAMLLYSIQLYSDFSGGIDIVLGISKIMGINLVENFDSPYSSESIQEFWRRWHISLSSWIKDYIYIPLGGNRCSKFRKSFNVIIAFMVSGLWHGVNYILWGLFHGIFVLLGDNFKTKYKWLNRIITFIIVSFLWSFFIWSDALTASKMIISVFTNFSLKAVTSNILNLGLNLTQWIILIVSTIILFIIDGNKAKIKERIAKLSPELKTVLLCTTVLIIIVLGIYGIGFNASEFIYSKF